LNLGNDWIARPTRWIGGIDLASKVSSAQTATGGAVFSAAARIAVKAPGLNRAEAMFRMGQYLEKPKFPARLGYEAAGDRADRAPAGGRARIQRRGIESKVTAQIPVSENGIGVRRAEIAGGSSRRST